MSEHQQALSAVVEYEQKLGVILSNERNQQGIKAKSGRA